MIISWLQVPSTVTKEYGDLFDEDDNDFLNGDLTELQSSPKVTANEEDDDDDLMLASGRPRHRGAILEDDESSLGTVQNGFLQLSIAWGFLEGAGGSAVGMAYNLCQGCPVFYHATQLLSMLFPISHAIAIR